MSLKWNYRRAFLRCALLVAAGTVLQLTAGDIDAGFLRYPWGAILAVNYAYLLVLAYAFSGRFRWLGTLWDSRACISSMSVLLVLLIVFGLVRQDASAAGAAGLMGWSRMSSSWTFNLLLLYFMTSMGIRTVSETVSMCSSFRAAVNGRSAGKAGPPSAQSGGIQVSPAGQWRALFRTVPRTVIHAGVFLLIMAGVFGSGDKVRCKVAARQGVPVNTADVRPEFTEPDSSARMLSVRGNDAVSLPFSITLRKFSMEEYPPKFYIYDSVSGTLSREFFQSETPGEQHCIGGWSLRTDAYIGMAGHMPGDSVYREMKHVGAVPAAYITAVRNTVSADSPDAACTSVQDSDVRSGDGTEGRTSETVSGWVSCGSHVFGPSVLALDGGKMLVMRYPEAKSYMSEVRLAWPGGKVTDADIRVNHPTEAGPWRIYQAGYDTSRGRWSSVSVLECVYDPWYRLAHAALWMILSGGVLMFLTAGGRRQSGKEAVK